MFGVFCQGHSVKFEHGEKQRGNTCKALMVVDSKNFRKKLMASYKRYKTNLSKLKAELTRFTEQDQPAYERFMAQNFGQEESTLRELEEKMNLISFRMGQIQFVASRSGMKAERFCNFFRTKWPKDEDFWNALNDEAKKFYE